MPIHFWGLPSTISLWASITYTSYPACRVCSRTHVWVPAAPSPWVFISVIFLTKDPTSTFKNSYFHVQSAGKPLPPMSALRSFPSSWNVTYDALQLVPFLTCTRCNSGGMNILTFTGYWVRTWIIRTSQQVCFWKCKLGNSRHDIIGPGRCWYPGASKRAERSANTRGHGRGNTEWEVWVKMDGPSSGYGFRLEGWDRRPCWTLKICSQCFQKARGCAGMMFDGFLNIHGN